MTHHHAANTKLAFTSCAFDDLFEMVEAASHPAFPHAAEVTLPAALHPYFEFRS